MFGSVFSFYIRKSSKYLHQPPDQQLSVQVKHVWPDSGVSDRVLLIPSELADVACLRTNHHPLRLNKLIFES